VNEFGQSLSAGPKSSVSQCITGKSRPSVNTQRQLEL
jgi:hypothetical protein